MSSPGEPLSDAEIQALLARAVKLYADDGRLLQTMVGM